MVILKAAAHAPVAAEAEDDGNEPPHIDKRNLACRHFELLRAPDKVTEAMYRVLMKEELLGARQSTPSSAT